MPVVPVRESAIFAVWDADSVIVLRIMYHLIPFVAVGSAASIVVRVTECSRIAQQHTLVCYVVTEQSRSCRACDDTLRDVCGNVAIKSRVVWVFGGVIDMVALGNAGAG